MLLAGPTRLADGLWLAAHDAVGGRPQIGDWALGVGLAIGLLAELVHAGRLVLQQGELFRVSGDSLTDTALLAVVSKMADEERCSQPVPVPSGHGRRDWAELVVDGGNRGMPALGGRGRPLPEMGAAAVRHRHRGHVLADWASYLAYERRAEGLVVERLARDALVHRCEKRRLFGGVTVRYRPADANVSGLAAHSISSALHAGRQLTRSQLFVAGLMLATGLHHAALSTSTPAERNVLGRLLTHDLDPMSQELLKAVGIAISEAAMR